MKPPTEPPAFKYETQTPPEDSVACLLELEKQIALAEAGKITPEELTRREEKLFGGPAVLSESADGVLGGNA